VDSESKRIIDKPEANSYTLRMFNWSPRRSNAKPVTPTERNMEMADSLKGGEPTTKKKPKKKAAAKKTTKKTAKKR